MGESPALLRVVQQVLDVAPTDLPVLILGETGTGKELFAQVSHAWSQRSGRPLVRVNVGAIPPGVFESEFFGHQKGAFTGATRDRIGRFGLADQGTLFLDEIGELPRDIQAKLLRVVQEGEFERVGDDCTIKVDVRLIAATNRDLRAEVAAGRFREDLYYRLSGFPLRVPPLRERAEDIPALARHFAFQARGLPGCGGFSLSDDDLALLTGFDWPGNVRELANVIKRMAVLTRSMPPSEVRLILEREEVSACVGVGRTEQGALAGPADEAAAPPTCGSFVRAEVLREREKDNLVAALRFAGWRIYGAGGAAALLGMKPTTLTSRMKALGIRRPG